MLLSLKRQIEKSVVKLDKLLVCICIPFIFLSDDGMHG